MPISGRWRAGYTLDYHTVSSDYLDDDFGYKRYDTKRTDLGELLYQLKYRSNQAVVDELVEAAATFIESWQPGADVLVPVPASRPSRLRKNPSGFSCVGLILRFCNSQSRIFDMFSGLFGSVRGLEGRFPVQKADHCLWC
jgi:predicted amidophosphoribosyltransferase